MTDHGDQDLSAQIRSLFPGDSAAVSADEAIGIATGETASGKARTRLRDGRRAQRTIGLRPAIAWGLALIAASIALGVGIGRTSSSGNSVNPTTRTSTTTATNPTLRIGDSVGYQDLDAVSFVNDDLGFGVASSFPSNAGSPNQQMLVRTDDGGETWIAKGKLPKQPGGSPQAVFTSKSNGFLWARSSRTIARTGDGGTSWIPLTLEAPAIEDSRFGRSAVIVEGDCSGAVTGCLDVWVAWSSDGGWTWKQTQIPRYLASNLDISYSTTGASLASSTDAYVIAYGNLYTSDDLGASWQSTLMEPCLDGGSDVNAIELAATDKPVPTEFVACGSSVGNHAIAVYRRTGGGFWILMSSTDWGVSQTDIGSSDRSNETFGYVGPIEAVSATTAYMVLDNVGLIFTTDGGRDWRITTMGYAGQGGGVGSVQFVDPNHGWALFTGAEGLFRTTTGSDWAPLDGTPGST